jgi:predicted ferric reductase
VAVVVLWLSGRGLQSLFSSTGELLTSLGRATGLVAADLLLVQVVLMARVPWIERSFGQDELTRRHRLVGFWSVNLLAAHLVLITVGYAASARTGVAGQAWSLVTTYPGMLLALAGTLLLVLVSVTSVRAARRALRYESWHLLHLYAYTGVGLSIPHELWTGHDFMSSALARAYWLGAYLLAAAAIVVFRVGLPLWRTVQQGLTVTSVTHHGGGVVTVRMGGRMLHRLPVQAGQFFIWRFLDGPGWSRGHPYSISSAPRFDRIEITAKAAGDGSRRLASLRPGTRVLLEGPYGRLTADRRTCRRLTMIASGIGITPLRALLEELPYTAGDAVLIYRARSEHDILFRAELERLAQHRGVTVHYVVGPRMRTRASWLPAWAADWRDPDALLHLAPELSRSDVYVCGPVPWMDAVGAAALRAGLPREQLHEERFAW